MKKLLLIIVFLFYIGLTAQSQDSSKYPFDVNTLVILTPFSDKNIQPKFENGEFFYVHTKNQKKVFDIGFQEAYPFINGSALVKKSDKYGIIDSKGFFLLKPKYKTFHLTDYEDMGPGTIVVFDRDIIGNYYQFDLYTGKEAIQENFMNCVDIYYPRLDIFKKKNKYGIKDIREGIFIEAKYDTILDTAPSFFIVKIKNKIGVISHKNEILIPLEYDDLIVLKDDFYSKSKIGLEKNNEWTYFNNNLKITTSKYKCLILNTLRLKNAVGIFKQDEKYNILYKNGQILKNYYDWISNNALIGFKDNHTYFIKEDGTVSLYH